MADATTRSSLLELKQERQAMHEGYAFLDEKCLLLAGEIVRELALYAEAQALLAAARDAAVAALAAAIMRHGVEGLQVYPPAAARSLSMRVTKRLLIGVPLQQAQVDEMPTESPPAAEPSVEAEQCRTMFRQLVEAALQLGVLRGNLERLSREYRRSIRRARALQDVLMPELDRTIAEIDTRLEELEQEDAICMRIGSSPRAT